jgi:hypothetical protein
MTTPQELSELTEQGKRDFQAGRHEPQLASRLPRPILDWRSANAANEEQLGVTLLLRRLQEALDQIAGR